MSTAEQLVRREAARQRGAPMISVAGEASAPYSIARAALCDGTGFEGEVSAELQRSLHSLPGFRHHGGVLLPPQLFAALETGTPTGGQELVFTVPGPFGRALRPSPVAARLGVRIIPGPMSVRLVRIQSGHQVAWISGETLEDPLEQQDVAFASESPKPSLGMVSTSWTRQLAVQATPAVGSLLEDDIRASVAAVIDAGLIAGSGNDGEPTGLLARVLPSMDLEGAAPTWDDLTEAEARVADANADEQLGWLTSGRGRQALRSCPVLGNAAAGPAWRNGVVLDWPAFASNHATGTIILAAWRNAVVALHAVEIVVNPYTRAGRGLIDATAFCLVSIGLLHPAFLLMRNPLFPAPPQS